MNALELLSDMTRRQVDRFFEAARAIPADKLDWQPAPGARSALDQVQEVATVFQGIPQAVTDRKLEFTPEMYEQMTNERKKVTDLDELERMTRESTERLIEFIQSVPPEELNDVVQMPWPGDFRVAGLLGYHYWNMTYHEGQIYYIGTLLAE
jgi:uncharacterized damage-inducible protein DinB